MVTVILQYKNRVINQKCSMTTNKLHHRFSCKVLIKIDISHDFLFYFSNIERQNQVKSLKDRQKRCHIPKNIQMYLFINYAKNIIYILRYVR